MELVPLLKRLTETDGISGYEEPICALVRETWTPLVDELRVGKLGSLIALKRGTGSDGPARKFLVACHMDEIGLLVSGIERGFLHVSGVGGADRRILLGQEVVVHGQRDLPGIVGTRPPHVLSPEDREKPVPWDKLFVDVGLPASEVEDLVSVGDLVTFRGPFTELKGGLVSSKALDNRASVAAVTLMLEALGHSRHTWDVYAVATSQEEVGLRGAIESAYAVAPDVALALDVTFGKQANVSDAQSYKLGEGPTIGVGPNMHPGVVQRLQSVAESREIPFHIEPNPMSSGTDAWAIQVSREGIPTGVVSIPVRYMHQPLEVLALKDVERAGRLLAAFVTSMDEAFVEDLQWDDQLDGPEGAG